MFLLNFLTGNYRQSKQTIRETSAGHSIQMACECFICRNRIVRQEVLFQLKGNAAAARDLDRVGNRFGDISEQRLHLPRAFQILLRRIVMVAPGIIENPSLMNADPCLMGFEIILDEEADIIRRDHRQ